MILAAGLGTRLRPLTDELPKALVPVGGRPMLERVAERLVAAGADRLIVNVHHHADRVESFLARWAHPGIDVRLSREEPDVLETGGGLRNARHLFRRDGPFFLHNVDVVSTVDLGALRAAHLDGRPLATLAVSERDSSRPLLFDDDGLYGRVTRQGTTVRVREPRGTIRKLGFGGIHVIEPRLLDLFDEAGAFSIVRTYMRLAAEGERILPWDFGDALWVDVGTPERLERAREVVDG